MVLTAPAGQVLKWVGGNINVHVFTEGGAADLDISAYVLGITTSGGAERWGQRFKVGTASIILDNTAGIFSSDAAVTKPFDMLFRPGRKVWIRIAPNPNTPTDFKPFFTGIIEDVAEDYQSAGYDNTVILRCNDNGAIWSGFNPPMLEDPTGVQYSGDRVNAALDRLDWPALERDIEAPGLHRLQSSFLAQTVWEECQTAADAEGGSFYAGADGKAVFRARDWLTVEQAATVIDTFSVSTLLRDNPRGLAFDGSKFWTIFETSAAEGGPAPYFLRSFDRDGSPLNLYNIGNWNLVDLTWDGTWLWGITQGLGATAAYFVQIDPSDGTIVNDPIDDPWIIVDDVRGITTDMQGNFWLVDKSWAYKWVPATATLTQAFPFLRGGGITWDGAHLLVAENGFLAGSEDRIYRINYGGLHLGSFVHPLSPSSVTSGLTWDGTLRVLDITTEDVIQMELYRPTTIQGYLGYSEVPHFAQSAPLLDVQTSFEIARVKNQVRFARVGGTMREADNLESQAIYGVRSYQRTDYKNSINDDVLFLAERYLSKHDIPRLRVESATYSGVRDPNNSDLNRLLWDIRYGDLLKVKVESGEGWFFERLVNVLGINHRITADDWEVTLRLDDTLTNYILNRPALVGSLDVLAWWSFEVSRTKDDSGRGHTLTWVPPTAVGWTTTGGPVPDMSASGVPVPGDDSFVTLNGYDTWATAANDGELTAQTDKSIEAWVQFDTVAAGTEVIISAAVDDTFDSDPLFQLLRIGSTLKVMFGDVVRNFRTPLVADVWYHVVITLDWNTYSNPWVPPTEQVNVALYLNGERGGYDLTIPEVSIPADVTRTLKVGYAHNYPGQGPMTGSISELAIYGKVLSETEVSDLYRSGY